MKRNFAKCLKIGKDWESKIEPWLKNHLGDDWQVVDTSDVYRDQDGDQFPDFTLINKKSNKASYFDAKKRCVYKHKGHKPSFGFDKNFYNSYTNIAQKHATVCYVGFYDPKFDSKNFYLLNMDQAPDFIHDYGNNGHGEPICYRWHVSNLKKFEL